MNIKNVIIEDGCTACGICEQICPSVFEVNDTAIIKPGAVFNKEPLKINDAAENCPVEVIKIELNEIEPKTVL